VSRRLVRARVVGVVVALSLAVACSDDSRSPEGFASSPTTSVPAATSSAPGATGGPVTDGPLSAAPTGGSTGATSTGGPTLAPVTPGPTVTNAPGTGAPAPAAGATPVGRYPATQDGSEQFASTGGTPTTRRYPSTTELRVSGSGARRVAEIAYSPDRDDTLTLAYTSGRIDLVSARGRVRVGTYEQTRDLRPTPAIVVLPASARAGQTFTGRFSGESTGRYDGRVLRRERLTVDGRPVDTVVVDLTITLESGPAVGTIRTTTWWEPTRSLPVKQTTETELRDALATYTQRVTVTLTSTTPR
jgi:hypothetical protein